ncbi:MAG: response regulator [Candidatus Nanopelagicales bacterium]
MGQILVVEDDGFTRMLLRSQLRELGHEIIGDVGTSAEAMMLIRSSRPTLVILDLDLGPGPSGVDVAYAVRKFVPSSGILVLSTYVDIRLIGDFRPLPPGAVFMVKRSLSDVSTLEAAMAAATDRELAQEIHRAHAIGGQWPVQCRNSEGTRHRGGVGGQGGGATHQSVGSEFDACTQPSSPDHPGLLRLRSRGHAYTNRHLDFVTRQLRAMRSSERQSVSPSPDGDSPTDEVNRDSMSELLKVPDLPDRIRQRDVSSATAVRLGVISAVCGTAILAVVLLVMSSEVLTAPTPLTVTSIAGLVGACLLCGIFTGVWVWAEATLARRAGGVGLLRFLCSYFLGGGLVGLLLVTLAKRTGFALRGPPALTIVSIAVAS